MENISMGSLRSLSLTNKAKENASIKVTTNSIPARSEGERSNVNHKGIKSKLRSKSDSDLQFLVPDERLAATKIVNHKRKLSEGEEEEVTSENISKSLLLIDPARKENGKKIKVSNCQKNEGNGVGGSGKADSEHHSFKDDNLVFTLDETDSDFSDMDENDHDAEDRRVFQFDLNELPSISSDEDSRD